MSLALQGGGSFGAFTWGVLDRLLDEKDLAFDCVSGASAGAMNAVVLASALLQGDRAAAKARLSRFWQKLSEAAPTLGSRGALALTGVPLSPYQFNPLNLNPLRTILSEEIDFDALQSNPSLRLFLSATRVSDGKLRIFRERSVSLNAVLASACLPQLHHAVTIDGEAYWDGGYTANPPLVPVVSASRATDVLLVQIIPTSGDETPITSAQINRRMQQITFNSSLMRELDALRSMKKLSATDPKASRLSRKMQRVTLHHLAAENCVPALAQCSALDLDWEFLIRLKDAGRSAADDWLRGFSSKSQQ